MSFVLPGSLAYPEGRTMYRVTPSRRWCLAWSVLFPTLGLAAPGDATKSPARVDFTRDVRPLLARCLRCHAPKKAEGGLRLDSRDRALVGGDSGPAIVAKWAAKSELIRRVSSSKAEHRMPPSGKRLSAA